MLKRQREANAQVRDTTGKGLRQGSFRRIPQRSAKESLRKVADLGGYGWKTPGSCPHRLGHESKGQPTDGLIRPQLVLSNYILKIHKKRID